MHTWLLRPSDKVHQLPEQLLILIEVPYQNKPKIITIEIPVAVTFEDELPLKGTAEELGFLSRSKALTETVVRPFNQFP